MKYTSILILPIHIWPGYKHLKIRAYLLDIFFYVLASTFFKDLLLFAQSMFHTPMQMIKHAMLFSPPLYFLFPIVPPAPNRCLLWTEKNEPTLCSFFLLFHVGTA